MDIEETIKNIIIDICELPDRTSPETQSNMLLVTQEELEDILRAHLGEKK